jgi:hypothetical protein
MNTLMIKLLPGVLIGLVMVFMISGTGLAAMQNMNSGQNMSSGACNLLEEQSANGVKFMSAGIGLDQRQRIGSEGLAKGYDLKLVFAKKSGEYVSDVNVTIKGKGHEALLTTDACGPWFYTSLPKGHYDIIVSYNGISESRSVTVGNGFKQLVFSWS